MKRSHDGYALLSVLALVMLLAGLCSLALSANLRQLRDNQQHAHGLQARADRLHLAAEEAGP